MITLTMDCLKCEMHIVVSCSLAVSGFGHSMHYQFSVIVRAVNVSCVVGCISSRPRVTPSLPSRMMTIAARYAWESTVGRLHEALVAGADP